MSGHTPGPWKVWESEGGERLVDADDADSRIAILQMATDADGLLIAAAPELLAALKKWMERYSRDTERLEFYKEAIAMTRAAIAKAEGRVA